jgi:hypothetical protein
MQAQCVTVAKRIGSRVCSNLGKLLLVIFSLLAYGQASAACNLSFSTTVGGQVTQSGSEYKYTFSTQNYADCDPGGNTNGTGSSLGIYVDAIGNQNGDGNKIFPSSSAQGTNNVYIMSIGGAIGPTNIDAFYYTPPNGYSGPDSFTFYDFNSNAFTVNVTVVAPVPGKPTGVAATPGSGQASVAFTAPASDGGSAILDYTVTSTPGGFTKTGTASPLTVTGLSNGTAYTFSVTARNANGSSAVSDPSSAVTPKASQTITFNPPGTQTFGTTPSLSATASSGLSPTFTSTTTTVCTITSGGVLTFVTAGSCTINADQAGNAAYLAATTAPQTFAVNAIAPDAPTGAVGTAGDGQVSVAFTAPASTGGSAILDYTVTSSPGGFTKTGTGSPLTVTGLSNGTAYTFSVTARNASGPSTASTASTAVTPKGAQTITFANPGALTYGTTPSLSATASSGLTPTFTSTTTGVCTITSGGVLTFVTAGACTINADQAGNAAYLAATTAPQTFAVNAIAPDAPTGAVGTAGDGQVSVAFTAPVSTGGSAILDYTVTSSPGGFTKTGTASPLTVTGLTNGTAYTFSVTARNSNGPSPASTASVAVTPKAAQTITFNNPGTLTYGMSPTLTATASSGLTPTFTSSTPSVCTVTSAGVLTLVSSGTCAINADQAGSASYLAATTVTQPFSVGEAVGVLTFATPGSASATMGSSFTNVATSTLSGGSYGAIGYSSSNTAVATVNASGVVTPVSAGTSTITATQAAVAGINTQVTQSYLLTVGKNAQTALNAVSDKSAITKVTGTATLTTTGGSGTGTVSYAVTTGSCSVTGSVLTAGSMAETCVVTVTKAADTNYSAATATVSIQVLNQATSTVTLTSSSSNPTVGQSVTLTATVAPAAATGTISFRDGATVIGGVNVSGGVASIATTTLAVGSHNLTAVYSGDAGTAGSTSAVLVVGVNVRPDPVNNAVVTQNMAYQAAATQRFTLAQMSNIYSHVQTLHGGFNVRNNFALSLSAPYLDTLRMVGSKVLSDYSKAQDSSALGAVADTSTTPAYPGRQKMSFSNGGTTKSPGARLNEDDEADTESAVGSDLLHIAGMPAAFWTAGNIEVGSLDALNSTLTQFSSKGLTMGVDLKVNPKLIAGASLGYAKDKATFDQLGSETLAEQWSGSAYFSYKPEKKWFIDGALGTGHVTYDNRRWDTTNSVLLHGDRKGRVLYGSLSLTREMNVQEFRLHPFGRIDVFDVRLDRYAEQGGTMALTFNDSSFTTTNFTGGLDISKDYSVANGLMTPSFKLQISSRAKGDVIQSMYYTDMGGTGQSYSAVVSGIPEDIQSVGLGLNFKHRGGLQANLAWLGSMGANAYRSNSLRLAVRYGF